MQVEYVNNECEHRGYCGVSFDDGQCRSDLSGKVKDSLLDREEWQDSLEMLRGLRDDTGFETSDELLADIQTLEDEVVKVQQFRVGEAYAEVLLEEEHSCRFHWNENRDARNPKGNKPGADLVGFIEVGGQVLFLFGEVKTSSEIANRPPQVMTGAKGIEKQLRDLYDNRSKRMILISYLKNKTRLYPDNHPFKTDFDSSQRAYYSVDGNYQLVGVLVRDVNVDENDLKASYGRLKNHILEPRGLKLLALYLPIKKEDWFDIINEQEE